MKIIPAKVPATPDIDEAPPEHIQLETRVQIELVGALIRQSRDAALIAPIGSLFIAWLHIGHTPFGVILLWLMTVTLPDSITILTSLKFDDAPKSLPVMRYWEARQTLLDCISGLGWGSSILFFVDASTPLADELKIVVVLMVITALSVIPMSSSLPTLIGFLCSVSLIPILHYLFGPHPDHLWLAAGTVILVAAALHFGWISHRQIRAHIIGSVINDNLATALSDANQTIIETNRLLQEKNLALMRAMDKLNTQATRDELTGLYNRRYILQRLKEQMQEVRRYRIPCSIAMIDLDHFKAVNDRHGHAIGDQVLKAFAQRIQGELRQGDVFARYGGEEFLLMLPVTELEAAVKLVERLRQSMEESPILDDPVPLEVRGSFGVAQMQPSEAVHDCIARADAALYRAKTKGRNRVEIAGAEAAPPDSGD